MGKRRGDRPRSRRRRSSRSRQGFRLESLEPRLLLSADPLGTLQELAAESLGAGEGAVQLMDAFDPKAGAVESLYHVLGDGRLNHSPSVTAGVRATECGSLLAEFFRKQRQLGKK